jgi:hypothetical protein
MIFSETNTKIAPALVKSWGELDNPKHNASVSVKMKTGGSYKFEYTDLNGIFNEARKVFKANGISVIQNGYTDVIEGTRVITVETMLLHSSGEYVKSNPLKFNAANSMQDFGGQLTYMKRYSLSAMLGISTEKDDDANGASGNQYEYQNKTPKQTYQAPPTTSTGPKMISPAQIKAIGTKTSLISKNTSVQQAQVYKSAADHLKIDKTTRELTASEASKVIEYLATLE